MGWDPLNREGTITCPTVQVTGKFWLEELRTLKGTWLLGVTWDEGFISISVRKATGLIVFMTMSFPPLEREMDPATHF